MSAAYLTMSHRELDRSEVMHRLLERRMNHLRPTSSFGHMASDLTMEARNAHRGRAEPHLGLGATWRARPLARS